VDLRRQLRFSSAETDRNPREPIAFVNLDQAPGDKQKVALHGKIAVSRYANRTEAGFVQLPGGLVRESRACLAPDSILSLVRRPSPEQIDTAMQGASILGHIRHHEIEVANFDLRGRSRFRIDRIHRGRRFRLLNRLRRD
jgi:hypothetical protein